MSELSQILATTPLPFLFTIPTSWGSRAIPKVSTFTRG